jgi:3-oxo-5-alpha-steroid 4-dehydrogenase 1
VNWYTGDPTYDTVLTLGLGFVFVVAVAAWFVPSPYGRFAWNRFNVRIDSRLGWLLMELPSPIAFACFFFAGPNRAQLVPLVFLAIWMAHYSNRAIAFPLLQRVPRGSQGSFNVAVVAIGWLATTLHGYLNGAFISTHASHLEPSWLTDPRFVVGIVLYVPSLVLTLHAEHVIRRLRTREDVASGKRVYRIPRGGLFEYVTNAPYLTELCAWVGFAIATWSLAGVFIFALTAANLVPRAFATHAWYRQRFEDYPAERKVLVPFLL